MTALKKVNQFKRSHFWACYCNLFETNVLLKSFLKSLPVCLCFSYLSTSRRQNPDFALEEVWRHWYFLWSYSPSVLPAWKTLLCSLLVYWELKTKQAIISQNTKKGTTVHKREMASSISSQIMISKICHSAPGWSFERNVYTSGFFRLNTLIDVIKRIPTVLLNVNTQSKDIFSCVVYVRVWLLLVLPQFLFWIDPDTKHGSCSQA